MTTPWATLSGAHVLLTGATGFVGQAVLERLLSAHPDCHVSVVIRPKGNLTAEDRLARLLRKPVFRTWRRQVGAAEADAIAARRITAIAGDVGTLSELPDDLDTVIHSASTVKFDSPIDEAFDTNVTGALGLYGALHASGATPHVVHVSTAYVGGLRKGRTPEKSLDHEVDWRAEADAAHTARQRIELASRQPEVLRELLAQARAEHGKAGPQAVTNAAELARREWVTSRLVDQGQLRAQSLGWTDVYTFTKALAERAAEDLWFREGQRLSVLRPTVIESALRHPYPGWIDGFKVADPLILAYGRAQLPDFPALPDSVLDIIPVDFVVNAILAAAATPPDAGGRRYFHIGSGASNPLAFHEMYENVHEYFVRSPLPKDGGHIQVPTWSLGGDRRVDRTMRQRETLVGSADWVLTRLPMTRRSRSWADRIHKLRRDLQSVRKLTDLYRPYVQTEMVFDDTRARELHESIPEADRADRGFDVTTIDWPTYLQGVHIPAIVTLSRAAKHRPAATPRPAPMLSVRSDTLAVFDLEGTILDWNLIEQYLWLCRSLTPVSRWPREVGSIAVSLPGYIRSELRDRGEFIRAFTRRYAGLPAEEIRRQARGAFGRAIHRRLLPGAVARAQAHRAAGHRTVLVTGSIDMLVEPLAYLFDDVVAGRMHENDGVLTGYLDSPPLVDEARAAWLTQYAERHGMDLRHSYGYGDSHADVAWIQLVGHPTAVNPDGKLYRHARRHGWAVVDWSRSTPAEPEATGAQSREMGEADTPRAADP
ncbi:HAD-IB family hydrolase [Actinobacteria bacterium YIM 96077]|uniref:HAD-IB family hydrolase n=1 Tax=Phytoactinopolyspora halophila TaxID=1981511 RepID=A0A329QEP4_9ACTN|nr:HAD-IB family hydrolase [Phytoactinopolyspora halophila]AYY13580.1 HAD-IB family hydrolase [Actinobacteria bacterium YIM 96077]RAW10754.1 HAD-IB family hydrolase [Phytoactinopolyspora halophila]